MSKITELTFRVDHYPNNSIEITVRRNCYQVMIYDIKEEIRRTLKLEQDSLWVFGVYQGTLNSLGRLFASDSDTLSESSERQLSFKRRPVQMHEEMILIGRDERALELIFWETKHHYETQTILPRPMDELSNNMTFQSKFIKLVASSKKIMSHITFPKPNTTFSLEYVEKLRSIPPTYLGYFFLVEECILQCDLDTDPALLKGTPIHVVLDQYRLIFMDVLEKKEVISWRWNRVSDLAIETFDKPKATIIFGILDRDDKKIVKCIPVVTQHNHYIKYMIFYMRGHYFDNLDSSEESDYSDDEPFYMYHDDDEDDVEEYVNQFAVPCRLELLRNALTIEEIKMEQSMSEDSA